MFHECSVITILSDIFLKIVVIKWSKQKKLQILYKFLNFTIGLIPKFQEEILAIAMTIRVRYITLFYYNILHFLLNLNFKL